MRLYDTDSLFDLDPGPWALDRETSLWSTLDGRVAEPAFLTSKQVWDRWNSRFIETFEFRRAKWVKGSPNAKGYIRLMTGDLSHRVTARAWVPQIEDKHIVHHADHNKQNNYVSNLEWVTNAENVQAAYDAGRYGKTRLRDSLGRFISTKQ
jgi:hypothetical protein